MKFYQRKFLFISCIFLIIFELGLTIKDNLQFKRVKVNKLSKGSRNLRNNASQLNNFKTQLLKLKRESNDNDNDFKYISRIIDSVKAENKLDFEANVYFYFEKILDYKAKGYFNIDSDTKERTKTAIKSWEGKDDAGQSFYTEENIKKDANQTKNLLKYLLDNYDLRPKKILDLAAGAGRVTKTLSEFYKKYSKDSSAIEIVSVEPGDKSFAKLSKRKFKLKVTPINATGQKYTCKSGEFDLIIGNWILENILDSELPSLYFKLKECLSENGIMIFKENYQHESKGNLPVYNTPRGQRIRNSKVYNLMNQLVGLRHIIVMSDSLVHLPFSSIVYVMKKDD